MSLLIWLGKGTRGGGLCEVHAWEMSPDVSGTRRGHREGLRAWDSCTWRHHLLQLAQDMESKASHYYFLPGVEFGSGTHLQSLWHESWGEAAGPLGSWPGWGPVIWGFQVLGVKGELAAHHPPSPAPQSAQGQC